MEKSIFQALREMEQTSAPMNEETQTASSGKDKPSTSGTDQKDNLNEEMNILVCAECGRVLGSVSEEEEIEGCPYCESANMVEKTVKVVRDGEVVKKTVKTKKKRLTAAQKQALAKARKKAHTGQAEKHRAKSLKKGRKSGLYEGDDYCECPECGFTGECDDFEKEDGEFICPECGASFTYESCKCKNESSQDEVLYGMLESADAPKKVFDQLVNGEYAEVKKYLKGIIG